MVPRIKIIAHRGYSSHYPDNSIAGFEQAWKLGADIIETDVREAKNGSLICSHDETDKEALPLGDALEFSRGKIQLLLDLKIDTPDFHMKVKEALLHHQVRDEVILGIRSLEQARTLRTLLTNTRQLGFLKDAEQFPEFYRAGGNIARLWEGDINDHNLRLAKGNGHPVFIMAGFYPKEKTGIGDITKERLAKLMALDIQGILVNDPAPALQIRSLMHNDSKPKRSPAHKI